MTLLLYHVNYNRIHCETQGEDLLRESGIPYTIVRPCALTEEPAGADLIFEQGDNITVHSRSCTYSLLLPSFILQEIFVG